MKIQGRNAVYEAIRSDVSVDRLAVSKDLKDAGAQKIINEAKSRGIKITFLDKEAIERESNGGRHQGFIAMITDYKYCEVADILAEASKKGKDPLIIILDGVEDPHNLGSIIRVAECGGADGIIIPKHRAVNVNETVVRVSSGAAAHVKIARVTNINTEIDNLKKQGIWVAAADITGENLFKANLKGALAIVIGGEGKGISHLTKQKCDRSVAIPMTGKVNSLNASVACGIILYEAVRQRTI